MTCLLQIKKFVVNDTQWTPLCVQLEGSALKTWFQFDGDLHLRSDVGDASTDYLCSAAKGDEFDLPVIGPISVGGGRPLVYVKAASGNVNCTLFCVMQ
jgi:hypothetical protein